MAFQLGNLGYLPEKSWDEIVAGEPYYGPLGPDTPVTNSFINASSAFSEDARRARDPITWGTDVLFGLGSMGGALLIGPVVDAVGNVGATAVNGYKRLYNNMAALYNNGANEINGYLVRKENSKKTPQTSLTGRKMQVMQPAQVITPTGNYENGVRYYYDQEPEVYLRGSDGTIVARVDSVNGEPAWKSVPAIAEEREAKAAALREKVQPKANGARSGVGSVVSEPVVDSPKKTIADALKAMKKNGTLTKDLKATKALINLYKSLK